MILLTNAFAGSESAKIILLRIKPTLNQSLVVARTKEYLLDLVFLCDVDNKNLYDCEHNDKECKDFLDFFPNLSVWLVN